MLHRLSTFLHGHSNTNTSVSIKKKFRTIAFLFLTALRIQNDAKLFLSVSLLSPFDVRCLLALNGCSAIGKQELTVVFNHQYYRVTLRMQYHFDALKKSVTCLFPLLNIKIKKDVPVTQKVYQ